MDAAGAKFAGEVNDFFFGHVFDEGGDGVEIFDFVVFEESFGVEIGDLGDGLGGHLEAAEHVEFGGFKVRFFEFAA